MQLPQQIVLFSKMGFLVESFIKHSKIYLLF